VRGVGSSNLPVPTIKFLLFSDLFRFLSSASAFHLANCVVIVTLSKDAMALFGHGFYLQTRLYPRFAANNTGAMRYRTKKHTDRN
jgi:hypothetical protein